MRLLPSIDAATRLTRAGKPAEALAALTGGGLPSAITTSLGKTLSRAFAPAGLRAARGSEGGSVDRKDAGHARSPLPIGASFTARAYASPRGTLDYKLYRPACAGARPLPLVVMLHGCTQTPDDFATGTRMNALAEAEGFFVAYPAQSRAANAQGCWNWFRAVDQGRSGEPALVAGLVDDLIGSESIDPARIYVAGLSAGGAAAAVLGQNYPELFAAVGVHSGLACGAALDVPSAFAAMRQGASAPARGKAVPTIVFHGDRDNTVAPVNGMQVAAQADPAAGGTRTVETGASPDGIAYTRTVVADAGGRPAVEHWVLHGAGHAWSGGDPAGSFTEPRGPDASRALWAFFRHHARADQR